MMIRCSRSPSTFSTITLDTISNSRSKEKAHLEVCHMAPKVHFWRIFISRYSKKWWG
jgi:hypothetical protein